MPSSTWVLSLLVLTAILPPAAVAQNLPIHTAIPDENGRLYFEPFHNVDWHAKATRALPQWNVDRPTPAQMEELRKNLPQPTDITGEPNTAMVSFGAPLDPVMKKGAYYFVTGKGIYRLQLLSVSGSIFYRLDESKKEIASMDFRGDIIAQTPRIKFDDGGFVFYNAAGPTVIRREPVPPGLLKRLPAKDKPEDIGVAYTLHFAGVNFLFVKWKGYPQDERAMCAFEYTLYRIDPAKPDSELEEISQGGFACDV
jgi:hypothetical protein